MLQTTQIDKSYNIKVIYPKERDVWVVDFGTQTGSKQGGIRPALIVSNDKYNFFSPTVTAIPISSRTYKKSPVHVFLNVGEVQGLYKDSIIEVEKMQDIVKFQLIKKIGVISDVKEREVAEKFTIQFPMLISLLKN
jgi:mRNA interferase MazF